MPRAEPLAGPQSAEHGAFRNQFWLLPSAQPGVLMRGRCPYAKRCRSGSSAMVVVPQRPGHGRTGGAYREDQGGCDGVDFAGATLTPMR